MLSPLFKSLRGHYDGRFFEYKAVSFIGAGILVGFWDWGLTSGNFYLRSHFDADEFELGLSRSFPDLPHFLVQIF